MPEQAKFDAEVLMDFEVLERIVAKVLQENQELFDAHIREVVAEAMAGKRPTRERG